MKSVSETRFAVLLVCFCCCCGLHEDQFFDSLGEDEWCVVVVVRGDVDVASFNGVLFVGLQFVWLSLS